MGRQVHIRVVIDWRMPLEEEVPEHVRAHWPARWYGVSWHEGRRLAIPSEVYRWLRRTQGDYMERCFTVTEGFGRTYLRAGPCPPERTVAGGVHVEELRRVREAAQAGAVVRRCGCGRR